MVRHNSVNFYNSNTILYNTFLGFILIAWIKSNYVETCCHNGEPNLIYIICNFKYLFGPTRENQLWRIKTTSELNKLIKHQNIVNYIKALRLSWFGHVQRMPDFRTAKKIFKWTPLTARPKGRPKQRWEDNVIQDIRLLNIKNWTACIQDRVKWKNVVVKAKTLKRES